MSKKLSLTLACGDYEITRPLLDGTVEPDGIDLTVLTHDHERIIKSDRRAECDVAEFNLIAYYMLRERGEPVTALPIFPHRRFRHGFVFVHTESQIAGASDLIGKRIAVRGRLPAAVVWIRGILQDHCGLPYDKVSWVDAHGLLGAPPDSDEAGSPRDPGEIVDDLLLAGKVAAMVSPHFPPPFLRRDPRIVRLFPDFESLEVAYFEQTGLFPIMHALTIRQDIVDRHPWVCASLAQAFERAKSLAYARVRNPRVVPLAFFQRAWERQADILGPDPWAYGLGAANRKNLETALRYAREQGLVSDQLSLSELFVDVPEGAFVGDRPSY